MSAPLTADLARKLLEYDPATGVLRWRERPREMFRTTERHWKRWNTCFAGREAFTALSHGYPNGRIFNRGYRAHRVIWLMVTGSWPDGEIDHIDHDRRNNRWDNLRAVPHRENSLNQRRRSNNTSGVTGVYFNKDVRKWQAYIVGNNEIQYLGIFDDIGEAAAVRRAAEQERGFHANHGKGIQ